MVVVSLIKLGRNFFRLYIYIYILKLVKWILHLFFFVEDSSFATCPKSCMIPSPCWMPISCMIRPLKPQLPSSNIKKNQKIETSNKLEKNQQHKPPLQCWGYGEPHYYEKIPHHVGRDPTSNIQEGSTCGEVVRRIP